LLVDAIPQKIVNNTVEQVVCTFIDITGRKAELALEEKGNEIREIKQRQTLFDNCSRSSKSIQYYFGIFKAIIKKYKSENFAQTELLLKLSDLRQKHPYLIRQFIELAKSQTGQLYFNPVL
jgi:hypothetical protein